MATANERIRDGIVRHSVGLIRITNGMRSQIIGHLNRTENDLRDRIISRTLPLTTDAGAGFVLDRTAKKRLDQLEESIAKARAPGFTAIRSQLTGDLTEIALQEPRFLASLVQAETPLDLSLRQPSASELRKIVTARPFQGRVLRDWASTIEVDERRRIMTEIRIGLTQGEDVKTIARRIVGSAELRGRDGVTQITRRQAEAIARTSVSHIANAARSEFSRANADLFDLEEYVAILDSRTTLLCRSLDGKLYRPDSGPRPPLHWQCRSSRVPYIAPHAAIRQKLKPTERQAMLDQFVAREGLGRVRSTRSLTPSQRRKFDAFARNSVRERIGGAPERMTQDQFLDGMNAAEQADILGVTKARLRRQGNLSLGRMVDRHGKPLTLADLAVKEAEAFKAAGLDPDDFRRESQG